MSTGCVSLSGVRLFRSVGVVALLIVAGCTDEPSAVAVVPDGIEVSADRRTVTVSAGYPRSVGCAKEPGGLNVRVDGDLAVIEAVVQNTKLQDGCTLECGSIVQTVTLDEPLPETVRFEAVDGADSGCTGISPLLTTVPTTTEPERCESGHLPTEFDRGLVPGPPRPEDHEDREAAGAAAVVELSDLLLGADAGGAVASLRGVGWTVTVVERTATPTTATPDLLWARVVVTTCGGLVDDITFD